MTRYPPEPYPAWEPEPEEQGFLERHSKALALGLGAVLLVIAGVIAAVVLQPDFGDLTADASASPGASGSSVNGSSLPGTGASPGVPTRPPGPTANPSLPTAACLTGATQLAALGVTPPELILAGGEGGEAGEGFAVAEKALAVDLDGCAHVVAERPDGRLVYLSNRSGRWVEQRLPEIREGCKGTEFADDIATDRDGSAWILITRVCDRRRFDTTGAFYLSNAAGSWSEPVRVTDAGAWNHSFAVRDGVLHVAYASGTELRYRTNLNGSWTDAQVARRVAAGGTDLILDGDGRPHILFIGNAIRYAAATGPSGAFESEKVADYEEAWSPTLGLDGSGQPHALWMQDWQGSTGVTAAYTRRTDAWQGGEDPFGQDVEALGLAIDGAGAAHAFAGEEDGGILHASNSAGEFETQTIFPDWSAWYATGAVAMDPLGRAHLVFAATHAGRGLGLWHAVGVPVLARLVDPLQASLEVDATQLLADGAVASVSGTMFCSEPIEGVVLSVILEQAENEISAFADGEITTDCRPEVTSWTVAGLESSHESDFQPGAAVVLAGATVCRSHYDIHVCELVTASGTTELVGSGGPQPPGSQPPASRPPATPPPSTLPPSTPPPASAPPPTDPPASIPIPSSQSVPTAAPGG